jgi:type I restriction enzyme S subunit
MNVGTLIPHFKKGDFDNLLLPIPDRDTQRIIGDVYFILSSKIDLLRCQNATLEKIAQTIFKEWFVKFKVKSEKLKVNSKTGLPEGWKMGKLGEFIKELISGEWGQDIPDSDFLERVICLRGTDLPDIKTGLLSRAPFRYLKKSKLEKVQVLNGDLIVEISGGTIGQSTGRIAYINQRVLNRISMPLVASNFCRVLRLKNISHRPFIYSYWEYFYGTGIFFNFENGTTGIQNLDLKGFLEYDVVIPNKEAIEKYCIFADKIFEKIQNNNSQIQTLSKLRDALLPKLMKGEIRVKDTEPFIKERIK